MSDFSVQLDKPAQKQLKKLRKTGTHGSVEDALLEMEHDPFGGDLKKLEGDKGYRRRVGKYRILFDVDTAVRLVNVYGILKRDHAFRIF